MKLMDVFAGARPTRPAYDALRASLRAAQAATPTARASSRLDRASRQVAALSGSLGALASEDRLQSWLSGSFYSLDKLPDDRSL